MLTIPPSIAGEAFEIEPSIFQRVGRGLRSVWNLGKGKRFAKVTWTPANTVFLFITVPSRQVRPGVCVGVCL